MRDDQYYLIDNTKLVPTDDPVLLAEALFSSFPAFAGASEHHTVDTAKRFVAMLRQMTDKRSEEFTFTVFPNDGIDQMITLGPIPYYTLCAHHVVPFYGNAYVGYIPDDKMAGLSKFARAVKYMAKGLWVQEELTNEIANFLEDKLAPIGVAVVLTGEHMCMSMRGVQAAGVITTTSSMRGVFLNPATGARNEFLNFVGVGQHNGK